MHIHFLNLTAARNLKSLREEHGLTQAQMAELLTRSLDSYRNWEQGKKCFDLGDIYLLSQALGLKSDSVFNKLIDGLPD